MPLKLAWSRLALGPSLQVKDGSLALLSCLSVGYNLHWFPDVLGLGFTFHFNHSANTNRILSFIYNQIYSMV